MAKEIYIGGPSAGNMIGALGDMEIGTVYKTTAEAEYVKNSSLCKYGSGSQAFQQSASATELSYTLRDSSGALGLKSVSDHKYYFCIWVMQRTSVNLSLSVKLSVDEIISKAKNTQLNVWEQHSTVFTPSENVLNASMDIICNDYPGNNALMNIDGLMLVDLTATYGSGNEPDKAWCDANIPFTTSSESGKGLARKIKKCYIGVDGVARKIKKAYIGVDGVARLTWTSGDTWKKYSASRSWNDGWYSQTDYEVGNTHTSGGYYGSPVSTNFYDGYTFSQDSGFSGTTTSSSGKYKVDSTHVYIAGEFAVNEDKTTDDNIYVDITWECVASALYYSGYYTYSKGAYIEDVEAEEGQLPTAFTVEKTEDNGNRVYVYENGTLYCYEKVA